MGSVFGGIPQGSILGPLLLLIIILPCHCKCVCVCVRARHCTHTHLENGAVDNFTYLGSNITNDGEVVNKVSVRLGKAARAFAILNL